MAAFTILVSLWSLVLAQDSPACVTDQCGLKGGSKDETSMVQVNVGQSRVKSDLLSTAVLAAPGQSCQEKCGGVNGGPDACDADATLALTEAALDDLSLAFFGIPCSEHVQSPVPIPTGAPYIVSPLPGQTVYVCESPPVGDSTSCSTPPPSATDLDLIPGAEDPRRACVCKATSAENVGDPHIHSFRGAHYTLLQQGVFVAWNFSKAVPSAAPAEWQLLAAYAGERFTTQGLLLLDPHAGSMEMTADDCTWRIKQENSPWRKADLEQISAEVGTTSLQVKKLQEKLGETKILKSSIVLQMRSWSSGMKNVAKLFTHCVPQKHLDFKITMFDRKDVEYVGGELGVAPDANNNYHFFTKKSMVQMRADQEFKAPGSWVTLGGSPAGAAYLEKQHTAASLMQSQGCSDAEEEAATAVCSKHLDEATHAETFADCIFDLCHGGDESFAQSAAAFLMPLDNSA